MLVRIVAIYTRKYSNHIVVVEITPPHKSRYPIQPRLMAKLVDRESLSADVVGKQQTEAQLLISIPRIVCRHTFLPGLVPSIFSRRKMRSASMALHCRRYERADTNLVIRAAYN